MSERNAATAQRACKEHDQLQPAPAKPTVASAQRD